MVSSTDWRLMGQESYLAGKELRRCKYRRYPENPSWDHDHCEFCGAKFMIEDHPDVLHEGFATLDEYHWICDGCFRDFQDQFNWILVQEESSSK